MISPMIHFTFAVFYAQYEKFLDDIQGLGIVHVKKQGTGQLEKEYSEIQENYDSVARVLHELKKRDVEKSNPKYSWEEIVEKYDSCTNTIHSLKKEKENLELQISEASPWGDFSPELIDKLEKAGIQTRFYKIREKDFKSQWLDEYPLAKVSEAGADIYFACFGPEPGTFPKAQEVTRPDTGAGELTKAFEKTGEEIDKNEETLNGLAASGIVVLEEKLKELATNIEFFQVLNSHTVTHGEGKVKVLEGWVPESEQQKLIDYLEANDILYSNYKTKAPDTPVKLVNSKFGRLFEPIGKLFSLPGYQEIDLTIYFAPFFLMFFGFCLGDGGYGLLILLAATIYKRKASPTMKPFITMGQYFGLATLIMGMIFGNFFGIELVKVPFLSPVKDLFLDSTKVFYLSLIVGGIQIMFGLCIKTANQIKQNSIWHGLGPLGWFVLILNLVVFSLLKQVHGELGPAAETVEKAILIIALLMILLFTDPDAKIHLRFASGLWSIYSTVTGIFGDMLSYIRLFALGISSSILGLVVNQMAISFSHIKIVGPVLFLLVVVIGHLGNLAISSLGSFVHPLRLTLVEFYKNAGFTGGGKKYDPFTKYKSIK